MTSDQALRLVNRDVRRKGDPCWWQVSGLGVHPERCIAVPLVRRADAELIARSFFADVAHDSELMARRLGILQQWGRG